MALSAVFNYRLMVFFILTIWLHRERDTTGQLIGPIDEVIGVVTGLVQGSIDWAEACKMLPAYDGVQAVD